jgi:putative transposase
MPDHLHVLVEGLQESSDLEAFAKHFKQLTGFRYKRATGRRLWQEGYYDRVLRKDEDLEDAARYVLGNPVRAGLVQHPLDWPHLATERYSLRELLTGVERGTRV